MSRVAIWRGATLGLVGGTIWCLLTINSRMHFWQRGVYDHLYVGMPAQKAIELLRSSGVKCGLTEPTADSVACHFSDAWYEYIVAVDSRTGQVGRKQASPD
jgi:hypothetical protein